MFKPEGEPAGDVLVVIFLRGAMDGLHTVPPHADPSYHKQRATLAVKEPGKPEGALDLDGFFGLHPAMAPLHELYGAKKLAIVHAIGSPDTTLSHFEAMQTMERGVSNGDAAASGWISRHLASAGAENKSPVRALAFADVLPKSMQGGLGGMAVRSLKEFRLSVPKEWGSGFRSTLEEMYSLGDDPAAHSGDQVLKLLRRLEKLDPDTYVPEGGARYPALAPLSGFGEGLKQTAQLIKEGLGLEVASVDLGGWDSHVAQPALLSVLMPALSQGLHAFATDLGGHMERVTVIAMSEFGRRAHENSGLGTDHGRGTAMFLLGGGIRGGKVYGEWPGVADGQLDRDGNLRVTTDYRDVLGEIVTQRLRNPNVAAVFPDYRPAPLGVAHPAG
jgi:uncharacterized protein (DUF1501 family)